MDPNSKDPNSKKEDKKDVKVETRVVITSKIENNKTMKQKLCNAWPPYIRDRQGAQ